MTDIEHLFTELTTHQQNKVRHYASQIVPNITDEDLLQPNDYPELDNNPIFRYEEGYLAGLHAAWMALKAVKCESLDRS